MAKIGEIEWLTEGYNRKATIASRVNGKTLFNEFKISKDCELIDPGVIDRHVIEEHARSLADEVNKMAPTVIGSTTSTGICDPYGTTNDWDGTCTNTNSTSANITIQDIRTAYNTYNTDKQLYIETSNMVREICETRTTAAWKTGTYLYGNDYFTTTGTNTCSDSLLEYSGDWAQKIRKRSPQDAIRDIIRSQQAPVVIINGGRRALQNTNDPRELNARQTLRMMIGADAFRKYLKHGGVSVQAKSGLVYRMRTGHGLTDVYQNGELIDKLCVVLSGGYTPTDETIMRYVMIQTDEKGFRAKGIKHGTAQYTRTQQEEIPQLTLPERFKKLKEAA